MILNADQISEAAKEAFAPFFDKWMPDISLGDERATEFATAVYEFALRLDREIVLSGFELLDAVERIRRGSENGG